MKKFFVVATMFSCLALGMYSCKSKQETKQNQGPQTVSGLVMDASMNNISIITSTGDTLNISTMDADQTKVPGVMLNDSITVTYILEKIDETSEVKKATELIIIAHSPFFYIAGTWVEPNPIKTAEVQGFTLNADGTASSVNMHTLLVEKWILENKQLFLTTKSIGNRQTFEGIDTLDIVKLDADSLILSNKGNIIWCLARQK